VDTKCVPKPFNTEAVKERVPTPFNPTTENARPENGQVSDRNVFRIRKITSTGTPGCSKTILL
jgi:hypothetical protein